MVTLLSIQDKSTSGAIYSGNALYCFAKEFTFGGENVISAIAKTAQPTFTDEDGVVEPDKYINAHNRKKAYKQYASSTAPKITTSLVFKYEDRAALTKKIDGSSVNWLNLNRLMNFINTPRTYYLKNVKLQEQLSDVAESIAYYKDYGIPVVISTWSIEANPNGNGDVIVSLTFDEDVDSLI